MGTWFKVFTTPKIVFLICFTLFMFSLAFSYTGKRILTKNDDFGIYYSGIALKKDDKSEVTKKKVNRDKGKDKMSENTAKKKKKVK